MKTVKKFLTFSVLVYTLVSLLLSCFASVGIARWESITHRAPFVLIDIAVSTVESIRDDGKPEGANQHGEYIAFATDVQPGNRILSVFVWNPFTNWCDDIVTRFDIAAWN